MTSTLALYEYTSNDLAQMNPDKLIGSLDRDISHGVAGFLSNMAG